MFQDRCTVALDEIWVEIWDICIENKGNTSLVYTTCALADILVNDGAKTLTCKVQSNEKINNSSIYVTVYAMVASKTRILKTATHRHAVSRRGCVFFIGHGKKGLCTDFLVHAAGPENLMIFFGGGLIYKIKEVAKGNFEAQQQRFLAIPQLLLQCKNKKKLLWLLRNLLGLNNHNPLGLKVILSHIHQIERNMLREVGIRNSSPPLSKPHLPQNIYVQPFPLPALPHPDIPVGGRLGHFVEQWEELIDNKWVLSIIRNGFKNGKRKVQGVPQSQTAALPRPQEEEKRKPTNLNKHKPDKHTKSTKISSLFPKQGNRNTKRTEKHKNKMTHGKTYNKSPHRINHKATKSKTNTGTTALERSVEQTTWGVVKDFYS